MASQTLYGQDAQDLLDSLEHHASREEMARRIARAKAWLTPNADGSVTIKLPAQRDVPAKSEKEIRPMKISIDRVRLAGAMTLYQLGVAEAKTVAQAAALANVSPQEFRERREEFKVPVYLRTPDEREEERLADEAAAREDDRDSAAAEASLAEMKRTGERGRPLAEVLVELGIGTAVVEKEEEPPVDPHLLLPAAMKLHELGEVSEEEAIQIAQVAPIDLVRMRDFYVGMLGLLDWQYQTIKELEQRLKVIDSPPTSFGRLR